MVVAGVVVLALAGVARADAGTPLMWAGMLHLVLGNLIIGIGEGIILALVFRLRKVKTIGIMIAANYFSAWVGGFFLRSEIVTSVPLDLYNAWRFLWIMVAVTYVLTLILEFPFVAFALRKDKKWLLKSIIASLVVQTASYAVLTGWYWTASAKSLYTDAHVVRLAEMDAPQDVTMYFISADDGDVCKMRIDGAEKTRVFDLNSKGLNDCLFLQSSAPDGNNCDMVACLATDDSRHPDLVTIRESFRADVPQYGQDRHKQREHDHDTWANFGDVARLGAANSSQWEFWCGDWAGEGLSGVRKDTGARLWLSYETPFGQWMVRNATHLPGDKVLFQLGDNQICLYDPETKRVALVTKGRGPVAVIEKK
jgi:hypothetical protein